VRREGGTPVRPIGVCGFAARDETRFLRGPFGAGSLAVWGARGMPDDDPDWAIIY
jgi:hypothetical protein